MAAELECAGEESRHATASNTAKNEKPKVEKIPQGGQLPAQRSLSVSEDMVPQSEAEVNQKVMEVCQELEATAETLKCHKEFLVWMDKLLKQQHGRNARLEAFGSTVCGFTTRNSDLDLTFHVVDEFFSEEQKKENLKRLSKLFRFKFGLNSYAVLNARVPVIKLKDPATGLSADLSVQNDLPVFKSKLLAEYSRIDHRLKHLVLVVKTWAKARGINCAAQGTLNSFGYTLLVVHYLQNISPPILPRLTDAAIELKGEARDRAVAAGRDLVVTLPEHPQGQVGPVVVHHHSTGALAGWGSDNVQSAGALLEGFFRYYVEEFDVTARALSVARPARESAADWHADWAAGKLQLHSNQDAALLLHDPLDPMDNVARNVHRQARDKIIAELHRAYSMVCEGLLGRMVEELRVGAPATKPRKGDGRKEERKEEGKKGGQSRGGGEKRAGEGGKGTGREERKEEGTGIGIALRERKEGGRKEEELAEELLKSHLEELVLGGGEEGRKGGRQGRR